MADPNCLFFRWQNKAAISPFTPHTLGKDHAPLLLVLALSSNSGAGAIVPVTAGLEIAVNDEAAATDMSPGLDLTQRPTRAEFQSSTRQTPRIIEFSIEAGILLGGNVRVPLYVAGSFFKFYDIMNDDTSHTTVRNLRNTTR
jgi:hypothetical protein